MTRRQAALLKTRIEEAYPGALVEARPQVGGVMITMELPEDPNNLVRRFRFMLGDGPSAILRLLLGDPQPV